uniref:hypothetical protein n=1 Tax=Okeania sp. SIO2F4 TaxID=2607790 RepID=UPI0025F655EB|nr:hypothetical protein [Okeania sp. SIO2F4]
MADSNGKTIENPRFYRKSEKQLIGQIVKNLRSTTKALNHSQTYVANPTAPLTTKLEIDMQGNI